MLVGTMQWGSSAMRGCVQARVQHIAGAPHVVGRSVHAGGSSAGVCSRASLLPLVSPTHPGAPSPVPCGPAGFQGRAPRLGPMQGGNGGWAGMAQAAAVPRPFLRSHQHQLCKHGLSRGSAPPGLQDGDMATSELTWTHWFGYPQVVGPHHKASPAVGVAARPLAAGC